MSSRNVSSLRPGTARDRILDAAARYGSLSHRQPAIAELARHAGVSRPTVYRYFADGDAVFRALWEREITALLEAHPIRYDDLDELVTGVVAIADRVSTHEVLAPTLAADPTLVARYVVDRFGTSQRLVFDRLRAALVELQALGEVRPGAPDELTAMLMLMLQSAVQSRSMIAEFLDATAWRRELGLALAGYLRP